MTTCFNPPPESDLLRHLITALQPDLILEFESGWHIVVSESPDRSLAIYKTLFNAATAGRFDQLPSYCFHSLDQLRSGLETGNIWYTTLMIQSTPLYNCKKHQLPTPLPQRLQQANRACQEQFTAGMQKSDAFREGAGYYHQQDNPEMAAFMLHQSMELLLHYLSLAVTGKESRSHCLKDNLQLCRYFARELYDCCQDKATNTTLASILHLNKAYSAVRYTQLFTISSEKIQQLLSLRDQLREIAIRLLQQFLYPFHASLHPEAPPAGAPPVSQIPNRTSINFDG